MKIVPLRAGHVLDVAHLHCESIPGLLQRLGIRSARAFYEGCVKSPLAIGYVSQEEDVLSGFILGSVSSELLRKDMLRRNPVQTLWGTAAGIIRHPSLIRHLLSHFFRLGSWEREREEPEVIYFAIAGRFRGQGIGSELLKIFERVLRERGASAVQLSVDADNRRAIRFYERAKFQLIEEYQEFGVARRRYRLPLGSGNQGQDQP